jgi:hypothetical protein
MLKPNLIIWWVNHVLICPSILRLTINFVWLDLWSFKGVSHHFYCHLLSSKTLQVFKCQMYSKAQFLTIMLFVCIGM